MNRSGAGLYMIWTLYWCNLSRICCILSHAGLPCVREKSGKNKIFSRSGNCQGILENIREFLPLDSCQGIVREFCHDIFLD